MNKKIVIGITGLAVIALNSVVFYAASAANTPKSVATSSAIKGAKWNPTVKLTYSKSSVLMQPTGIPNHARDAYYAVPNAGVVVPDATTANIIKDPTKAQTYNFTIPTTPVQPCSRSSLAVLLHCSGINAPSHGPCQKPLLAAIVKRQSLEPDILQVLRECSVLAWRNMLRSQRETLQSARGRPIARIAAYANEVYAALQQCMGCGHCLPNTSRCLGKPYSHGINSCLWP